jgi:hypothetical protein
MAEPSLDHRRMAGNVGINLLLSIPTASVGRSRRGVGFGFLCRRVRVRIRKVISRLAILDEIVYASAMIKMVQRHVRQTSGLRSGQESDQKHREAYSCLSASRRITAYVIVEYRQLRLNAL